MAWAKLDDAMPHHPKVMMAGPQAFALDVAAICYSNRFGCDGLITDELLPAVLPCLSSPRRHARRLEQAGRWERDDDRGGWWIHDIDDYQPTAADQEADRRAARRRMRELRANRRRTSPTRSGDVRPNGLRTGAERSGDVRNPVPYPEVPDGTSEQPPVEIPGTADAAWEEIATYIRRWGPHDDQRPDPPKWMRTLLADLGGIAAVRRDEVDVWSIRRAYKALT